MHEQEAASLLQALQHAKRKFAAGQLKEALDMYSAMLQRWPAHSTLLCNRATVHFKLGAYSLAADDARAALQAEPSNVKAWYRLGQALAELHQYADSLAALEAGRQAAAQLQMHAEAQACSSLAAKVAEQQAQRRQLVKQQAALWQLDASWSLSQARQADEQVELVQQLKQGLAAPDWDPEDWLWRPTFLPASIINPNSNHDFLLHELGTAAAALAYQGQLPPVAAPFALQLPAAPVAGAEHGEDAAHDAAEPTAPQAATTAGAAAAAAAAAATTAGAAAAAAAAAAEAVGTAEDELVGCSETATPKVRGPMGDAPDRKPAVSTDTAALHVLQQLAGGAARLESARLAVDVALDQQLLEAYREAVREAMWSRPGGGVVLVAERAPGVLFTVVKELAAEWEQGPTAHTAGRVPASCARAPTECHAAQEAAGPDAVEWVQCTRWHVTKWEECQLGSVGKVDILVTDLFDHSVLGCGILQLLEHLSDAAKGALVVPKRVEVWGVLLDTWLEDIAGFDLSPMNQYLWHPHMAACDLAGQLAKGWKQLSWPFLAAALDLQAIVSAGDADEVVNALHSHLESPGVVVAQQGRESSGARHAVVQRGSTPGTGCTTLPADVQVQVETSGKFTAVGVWPVLCMGLQAQYKCIAPVSASGPVKVHASPALASPDVVPPVEEDQGAAEQSLLPLLPLQQLPLLQQQQQQQQQQHASTEEHLWNATSLKAGVAYLEPHDVPAGKTVHLRVQEHGGLLRVRVLLDAAAEPHLAHLQDTPRHASLPAWHFDMMRDAVRNTAFDKAIRGAVAAAAASSPGAGSSHNSTSNRNQVLQGGVQVLDIGCGSGLLSMMAARAGASKVYSVESIAHLADVAEEVLAVNNCITRCAVIHKDARLLTCAGNRDLQADIAMRSAGGSMAVPDLEDPADVLVFEVFDAGLIGEGALHLAAAAWGRGLLRSQATVVPAAARVYCQAGQLRRVATVGSTDMQHLNQYHWRPDYESVDLSKEPTWTPLTGVQPVFDFRFDSLEAAVQQLEGAATQLRAAVEREGVVNAVAFWFDLQLWKDVELSSGPPECGNGTSWMQAVQWVEELKVAPGDIVQLEACHDSYGIKFQVGQRGSSDGEATGVPLKHSLWWAEHQQLEGLSAAVARTIAQDPLQRHSFAKAAAQLAACPAQCGNVDAGAAAQQCCQLFA